MRHAYGHRGGAVCPLQSVPAGCLKSRSAPGSDRNRSEIVFPSWQISNAVQIECPLGVKRRNTRGEQMFSALPPNRTSLNAVGMSETCQDRKSRFIVDIETPVRRYYDTHRKGGLVI